MHIDHYAHLSAAAAGGIRFCSATYRLFKPDDDSAAPSSKDPLMEVQYKGMND